MAKIYKTDGSKEDIFPQDGKKFELGELQLIVGGRIEMIDLPSGMVMVLKEEGKLEGLEKNEVAANKNISVFTQASIAYGFKKGMKFGFWAGILVSLIIYLIIK